MFSHTSHLCPTTHRTLEKHDLLAHDPAPVCPVAFNDVLINPHARSLQHAPSVGLDLSWDNALSVRATHFVSSIHPQASARVRIALVTAPSMAYANIKYKSGVFSVKAGRIQYNSHRRGLRPSTPVDSVLAVESYLGAFHHHTPSPHPSCPSIIPRSRHRASALCGPSVNTLTQAAMHRVLMGDRAARSASVRCPYGHCSAKKSGLRVGPLSIRRDYRCPSWKVAMRPPYMRLHGALHGGGAPQRPSSASVPFRFRFMLRCISFITSHPIPHPSSSPIISHPGAAHLRSPHRSQALTPLAQAAIHASSWETAPLAVRPDAVPIGTAGKIVRLVLGRGSAPRFDIGHLEPNINTERFSPHLRKAAGTAVYAIALCPVPRRSASTQYQRSAPQRASRKPRRIEPPPRGDAHSPSISPLERDSHFPRSHMHPAACPLKDGLRPDFGPPRAARQADGGPYLVTCHFSFNGRVWGRSATPRLLAVARAGEQINLDSRACAALQNPYAVAWYWKLRRFRPPVI
ncbi:hypothetical protein HYPSUDRAFT_202288 [Hypholoma sublateritium FD-334 SS-4]|uniref:Uncharacterized protein n=1 Tax=Hypholoma sublateritium (strain FD-334 SS-4) TaxID=945553 RepID=A0A0D2P0N6_HYPSF|nr:hypothetical protein HYPSUDRAFT_202288 [Hypholoma sublateritium FD-334 SS-4]